MVRDNEKILSLIGEVEGFIRSRLAALVEANADAGTIYCFVECLRELERATNNLGEYEFDETDSSDDDVDSDYEPDNSDAIAAIVREAIAPIEKRLTALIERLESSEGDR